MKRWIRRTVQVGLFILFAMLGDWLTSHFHIPCPGSIIGLLLVFVLLKLKLLRLEWVEDGANWMISELLLFFIPSAVGIVEYERLMKTEGIRLVAVITLSTLIVMACTGLLTEVLSRKIQSKRIRKKRRRGV